MMQSPCYNPTTKTDCPNRYVGCHSQCKTYMAYEQAKVLEYNRRLVQNSIRDVNIGYINESKLRYERRYKK